MSDFRATCPEGHEIVKVIQVVIAHAEIENFNRNKLPIYTGNSDVLYDTQESFAETGGGMRVVDDTSAKARYLCAGDCGEITYDQLAFAAI
jgi:hypothetical protein